MAWKYADASAAVTLTAFMLWAVTHVEHPEKLDYRHAAVMLALGWAIGGLVRSIRQS